MTTWKEKIEEDMEWYQDAWDNIIHVSLDTPKNRWTRTTVERFLQGEKPWYDILFHDGYGGNEGISFRVWTKTRVYFPITYDGEESVESVSRDPNDTDPVYHFGGGAC